MENKRSKLSLVLMTLVLLLVLAVGPVVPGVVYRIAEPRVGAVEVWAGLYIESDCPGGGGGSGGG